MTEQIQILSHNLEHICKRLKVLQLDSLENYF